MLQLFFQWKEKPGDKLARFFFFSDDIRDVQLGGDKVKEEKTATEVTSWKSLSRKVL